MDKLPPDAITAEIGRVPLVEAPDWRFNKVPFRIQLGELTVASAVLDLASRTASLHEVPLHLGQAPAAPAQPGADGYMVWSQPIDEALRAFTRHEAGLVYVTEKHARYGIDMTSGFQSYMAKFSAKSRSTLKRKLRKFTEISGGKIDWRQYRTPEEIETFRAMALPLSRKTYQHRLFDTGIPDAPDFCALSRRKAARDEVRAFLLFINDVPVSYLYCHIERGVVSYEHVGYDQKIASLSPGTVLQILALEALFQEARYAFFDFLGGEGEHKKFLATSSHLCANIVVLRPRFRPMFVAGCHFAGHRLSSTIGAALERAGLKARIRRYIRGRSAK
jgi:CelD/BcsL family acetyltransferase involved in cellulose biosynthesis